MTRSIMRSLRQLNFLLSYSCNVISALMYCRCRYHQCVAKTDFKFIPGCIGSFLINRISSTNRLRFTLCWYTPHICNFLQQTMDEMGDILEERPRGRHAALLFFYYLFLPRDAMHKHGLCCRAVSVCPSVMFMYSVETSKHIYKIFQLRVATPFSFFVPNVMSIFRQLPPNNGVECWWGRQKLRFSTNIWLDHLLSTVRLPQLRQLVASWLHLSLVSGVVCCSRETVDELFMM